MGPRENILSYSMEDGVGAGEYVKNLSKILEPLTADDEVVVLGDIIGGSPLTNALDLLAKKGLLSHTVAFSGANLPMAIGALMAIDDGLTGECLSIYERLACEVGFIIVLAGCHQQGCRQDRNIFK